MSYKLDLLNPPEMIPPLCKESFKGDLKQIEGELTSLKSGYGEITQTLADLKGACESLKGCTTELKSIISDLKVINDEFKANVVLLDKTLKTAQAAISQQEDIRDRIGVLESTEAPKQTTPSP